MAPGRPVTHNSYDASDRIYRVTDPAAGFIDFSYDAAGNLLTVKDQVNNTTSGAYLSRKAPPTL